MNEYLADMVEAKRLRAERLARRYAEFLRLYKLGSLDAAIALKVGVKHGVVRNWRKRNGFPSNRHLPRE